MFNIVGNDREVAREFQQLDGDGRIVEERRYFDSGSLFVQLGLAG